MEKRFLNLHIEKMVYGGYGLARKVGKIFFVEGAYPNEEVRATIEYEKGNVAFCKVKKIEKASPFRIEARCDEYSSCGGCDWMGLSCEKQLDYKREIFVEQMKRIAKMEVKNVKILPTSCYHYRNKVEYAVRKGKLGFFKKKTHHVVEVGECAIASKKLNTLKLAVEGMLAGHPDISPKIDKVILRTNEKEKMAILMLKDSFSHLDLDLDADHVVSVLKSSEKVHKGSGKLNFRIGEITYQVPALSFFQINTLGAQILAETVKEWAGEGKKALDLYCGVGLFSLQISEKFDHVTGIESFGRSVEAAKENAVLNEKANIEFKRALAEKITIEGHYDVIIMDPPRTGLKEELIETVLSSSPRRIVYVSCDSSTFARDVGIFVKNGFLLKRVKLVDMFPQTHHFETIGLMEKK